MSIAIFSYRGGVTVGVMVDSKLIPDPEEIVKGLEAEIEAFARIPPTVRGNGGTRLSRGSSRPQTLGRQ